MNSMPKYTESNYDVRLNLTECGYSLDDNTTVGSTCGSAKYAVIKDLERVERELRGMTDSIRSAAKAARPVELVSRDRDPFEDF